MYLSTEQQSKSCKTDQNWRKRKQDAFQVSNGPLYSPLVCTGLCPGTRSTESAKLPPCPGIEPGHRRGRSAALTTRLQIIRFLIAVNILKISNSTVYLSTEQNPNRVKRIKNGAKGNRMLFRSVTDRSIRLWCALGFAQGRGRPNPLNSRPAPESNQGIVGEGAQP